MITAFFRTIILYLLIIAGLRLMGKRQIGELEPGDLVVMKRGIWHDACHAAEGTAQYYFLSHSDSDPDETAWKAVQPAPVQVAL